MPRLHTRLSKFFFFVLLTAAAPLATTQAQGFGSISSGTPNVAAAAPPAANAEPAAVPVPTLASATPPPAFGGSVSTDLTAMPSPPANAGAVSPVIPAPTATFPAPVAPVGAASSAFSSGGGSFSSASGGAPSLPSPPPVEASHGAGSSAAFEMAEKVVVVKHERVLRLLRRGRMIAEYPIKLGLNPYGHKRREGDFRTPEGKYELVARNPQSEFYLSIKISYPNREDAAVANESGYSPGGLIMIHGQPNVPKRPAEHYATRDWTDGCIALSNADMVDVWMRTTVGIPIEIRP